jgi:cytochrome P450
MLPPRIVAPAKPLGALGFARAFLRNPLEAIPQAAYEEDAGRMTTMPAQGIWITSPALLKRVLLDERELFAKRVQIRLFRPLLGAGILTSEGAHWKWQRQASAPMFRPAELQAHVPTFIAAAEKWLGVGSGTDPEVLDIDREMSRLTFDVISSTLLPSSDGHAKRELERCVQALQRHAGWDILYAYLRLPMWMPRPGGMAKLHAIKWLRANTLSIVRERRGAAPAGDLIGRLIAATDPESGRSMEDEQLVDNLLTFYLAGHETTAKALTWTLYLLARYPEWQQRARDEPGVAEAVIKEAMRLYPPVPVMSRQPLADTEIAGYRVRAGATVLIPIYAIHRHTRWGRADEFDPTRFLAGSEERIPRYQYMPFGAGPRICIGMSFALMEAAAIVSTLLARVRVELADSAEPIPLAGVTLMPRGGLRLRIQRLSR